MGSALVVLLTILPLEKMASFRSISTTYLGGIILFSPQGCNHGSAVRTNAAPQIKGFGGLFY
jgi:hypothetical protein